MVGGFNRFRRPSVPEEVWHYQVVFFRELKERLPDSPVLPVVAPVEQDETLPSPGFSVPQRVFAHADLLFNWGDHAVVSPLLAHPYQTFRIGRRRAIHNPN